MYQANAMELVAQALGVDLRIVTEDSRYGDPPEWDSAGHMFIIVKIEAELRCVLENEDILSLTDIQSISLFLEKRRKGC